MYKIARLLGMYNETKKINLALSVMDKQSLAESEHDKTLKSFSEFLSEFNDYNLYIYEKNELSPKWSRKDFSDNSVKDINYPISYYNIRSVKDGDLGTKLIINFLEDSNYPGLYPVRTLSMKIFLNEETVFGVNDSELYISHNICCSDSLRREQIFFTYEKKD